MTVEAPHCPTCTCGRAKIKADEWRHYGVRTVGGDIERRCIGCQMTTYRPGPEGWWWRFVPADPRFGRQRGRTTESICPPCGQKVLAIATQHAVSR